MHLLLGCRSNTNDSSGKQKKGKNLNCPGLTAGVSEFMIEHNTQKSRNEKSATTKSVANSVSQSMSRSGIAKVTQSQQTSRPNGGPSLLPGCTEVLLECAPRSLDRPTHNNATGNSNQSPSLAKRPRSDKGSKRRQKENALRMTDPSRHYIGRHGNARLGAKRSARSIEEIEQSTKEAKKAEQLHGKLAINNDGKNHLARLLGGNRHGRLTGLGYLRSGLRGLRGGLGNRLGRLSRLSNGLNSRLSSRLGNRLSSRLGNSSGHGISRMILLQQVLRLLLILLVLVVHARRDYPSLKLPRSKGVQKNSHEQNAHTAENADRVASLGRVINEVGSNHAKEHGSTEQKGNGTGEAPTIGKHEHNHAEGHGAGAGHNRSTDREKQFLALLVRDLLKISQCPF